MKLFELFSSPTKWEWTDVSMSDIKIAEFTVGNFTYIVYFTYDDYNNIWTVEFGQKGVEHPEYGVTGTGNATSIFSTVIDIMRVFRKRHPGFPVGFTAEEPSRKKLYSRLIKNLPNAQIQELPSGEYFYFIP